jgi:EAL domain-containing protein (putative c-di-GMP-specific phosphodiesterase class I)
VVFIPVAEQSNLIVAIDEWVLGEVCRQIVEWDNSGLPPVRISVNISARHFRKEGMAADLMRSSAGMASRRSGCASRSPKAC